MTQETDSTADSIPERLIASSLGFVLLCLLGPLFLRLPLTNDAVLYDLEARWLQQDILPYRDIIEPNFPGVLVIHLCTRWILGESTFAIRCVDLILLCVTLLIAWKLVCLPKSHSKAATWGCVFCILFYLSQSEWCHCQRDTWLLLPALLGSLLRVYQVRRAASAESFTLSGNGLLEGLVWGAGIWLKPHLVVVCIVAWGLSLFLIPGWNRKMLDATGLLLGGLFAGGIGLLGLWQLGALPAFFASLSEWNPGYLAARFENWTPLRYLSMSYRFAPWILLHLVAVPLSLWSLLQFFRSSTSRNFESFVATLLSAVYVFWILQAHLLQHLFDYVHVPAILLALFVIAVHADKIALLRSPLLVSLFGLTALFASPLAESERFPLWVTAVQGELTSAQTDQLAYLANPQWKDLEAVEHYLREQHVQGRDVLMYNSDLVTLYWRLDLQSPTPFVYMYEMLNYFPHRKEMFVQSMLEGEQKYIVTDLVSCGMSIQRAEEVDQLGPLAPPPGYRRANLQHYPWSEPVTFRAGRYMVHRVLDKAETVLAPQPTE